jgi:hypothetical protein
VHHEVVGRDHRLRREAHHLLAQIDDGPGSIDERHQEVQTGAQGPRVAPEPFDDHRCRLRHDPHRA